MQGGSRIVIDLVRPARLEKTFTIDAANGQPDRLVLDQKFISEWKTTAGKPAK